MQQRRLSKNLDESFNQSIDNNLELNNAKGEEINLQKTL